MIHKYAPHKQVSLFFCFFFMVALGVFAQVGIGNTNPNANALLEIGDATTTTQGLLLPRVDLVSTTSFAPMAAHLQGMVVYNKNTAGDVTPGYYYNDGGQWVRLAADSPSSDWSRLGNTGTIPGTGVGQNYLGTSNSQDLVIATNGSERIRTLGNGQVSINEPSPFAVDRFTVQGADTEYAINGYTSNATGVYGENRIGIGNGVFGLSSNVGVRGYGANGSVFEAGVNNGVGVVAWNTATTGNTRMGLMAVGQNLPLTYFNNTGAVLYGTETGATSIANNTTGTGLTAGGNGLLSSYILNIGSGIAGTGLKVGVYGFSTETGVNNPNDGTISSAGGIFANANGGISYVAGWYDPIGGGNNDQNFKIIGTGNVSTVVKDPNEELRIMYAPEAPESLFQDYGVGSLKNGTAVITLDPILTKNIRVDDKHPLKVFIQLEGNCNGVYVTDKSANSFTVKELQNGKSSVSFSWSIVATRADEVFHSKDGKTRISHNNQRFPLAPKNLEIDEIRTIKNGVNEEITKITKTPEPNGKSSQKSTLTSGSEN